MTTVIKEIKSDIGVMIERKKGDCRGKQSFEQSLVEWVEF